MKSLRRSQTAPNKGVELTPYSVRSCLASASSRRSRLAFGGPSCIVCLG